MIALLCKMSWYRYECICLVCFPAVYATSAFLFRCRYQRGAWLIKLSAGAVLLLAALQYGIYISYILRFGGRPSASAVMTVLGTHTAEVQGFLLDQFGLRYMVLAVGIAIMSWAVPCFISERIVSSRRRKYAAFLLVLSLGLALAYRYKAESYSNLFFDFRSGVRQYRLAVKSMSLRRADRSHEAGTLHTVKRGTGEVCLVVVGESANRTHMACYGYDRPTTPWLSDDSRAICLERSYSCMTHTEPAVTMALSRLNNYAPGLNERTAMMPMIADSLSLIDFLRSVGVKTYWLSGQERIGNYNNFLTGKLAVCADKMKFLCDEPIVSGSGHFDGELAGYLQEILQQASLQENLVIFLHLQGSHWVYLHNVPTDWPWLQEKAGIAEELHDVWNAYDRTIFYTDSVLRAFIQELEKCKFTVSSMIYFSDHGEKVPGGHNFDNFVPDMAKIPVVFWGSNGYQRRYPETVAKISMNRKNIFTRDLMFEFILVVNHVTFDGLEYKRQFTSPLYHIDADNARFWQGRMLKDMIPDLREPS